MVGPITFTDQMCMNYFQVQPSWVKGQLNGETECERRYLYTKIFSRFQFKLPKNWPLNFFRYFLFYYGSIGCIYTKKFGWVIYPYGVTKLDFYYQPAEIEIWNNMLSTSKRGKIGLNAEIIRIMDDYAGLDDLVRRYAEKLANIDKSININLMNANVALLYRAADKKDATTIKEAYAEATTGKPFVAVQSNLLRDNPDGLKPLISSPKQNFIVLELLQSRREILNQFLIDVGIRTANYNKRAQMSDDEIRQSDDETKAVVTVILENLQDCFERLNRISDLELSVEYRSEKEGGAQDEV